MIKSLQIFPGVTGRLKYRVFLGVLGSFLMVQSLVSFASQESRNLEDEALHSRLINVSLELDWLNQKCRGLSIQRNFKMVNRLFIDKYSLSANNYIEGFFGVQMRDYKQQKSREMLRKLAQKRGCKQALDQDWDRELKKEYNSLLRKVEDSSWFPLVDRLEPTDLE